MKKVFGLIIVIFIGQSIVFSQTTPGQEGILVSEVTHEKKQGELQLANGENYKGIFSYREYGERIIKYYGPDGTSKVQKWEDAEEITSFTIEGRGTFYPVLLSAEATSHALALKTEEGSGYIEYKFCQVGQGSLGYKIVGGRIQGSKYDQIIYHERKDVYHNSRNIKKLEKHILTYVDYCPEITTKVQQKEKGYKRSLLMRDYHLLRKVISEAYNCGK